MPGRNRLSIIWLPKSLAELRSQFNYVAIRNERAAINLLGAVEASVDKLSSFPMNGRIGRVPATRELVIPGTRFIVVYAVDQDTVRILRVLHSAQQWPQT